MLPREPEVRKIEKQLVKRLNVILDEIKSHGTHDISLLQRQYNTQVQHALRSAIQKTYVIAGEHVISKRDKIGQPKPLTQYVMKRLKAGGHITESDEQQLLRGAALAAPLNEHFLTSNDLSAIVNKVQEYSGIFWRRVSAVFRSGDILPETRGYNAPATLNDNALVSSLGVDAITDSYSDAVVDKMDQLDNGNGRVQFVTAHDERVCPECEPLDGMEYDIDAVDDEPPIHDNCRCRLEPVGGAYEPAA